MLTLFAISLLTIVSTPVEQLSKTARQIAKAEQAISRCLNNQVQSSKMPKSKKSSKVTLQVVKKLIELSKTPTRDMTLKQGRPLCARAKRMRAILVKRLSLYIEKLELTLRYIQQTAPAIQMHTTHRSPAYRLQSKVTLSKKVALCWHARKLSRSAKLHMDVIRSIDMMATFCKGLGVLVF